MIADGNVSSIFLIFDARFWIGAEIAHATVAKGARELQM
jgi:hypothetical protein